MDKFHCGVAKISYSDLRGTQFVVSDILFEPGGDRVRQPKQTGRQGESRGIKKAFSTQTEDCDWYVRAAFDPSIRGIASPS
jgi:hypothetical protein